jgi:hypothetical protein
MSFGKNPYVPKAQAAEQKAQEAGDDASQARAYREAAHEWDRAAEREKPGKKRSEYEENATRNRELADGMATRDTQPLEPAAQKPAAQGVRILN